MSTQKPTIFGDSIDPEAHAFKIIKECYEKRFDENASRMAGWLGTKPQNVDNWLNGTTIPGWVVMKILETYEDIRKAVFEGAPVERVDPRRDALRQRIDRLLESEFMFDHLLVQVGICEDAINRKEMERVMAEALHLLGKKTTRAERQRAVELVLRRYDKYAEGHTLHETPTPYSEAVPRGTSETPTRTAIADPESEDESGSEPSGKK